MKRHTALSSHLLCTLLLALGLASAQTDRPAEGPEAAAMAAEHAGQLREAFLSYIAALQALPDPPALEDERRLREKLIRLVRRLEPPPRVPEEAERFGMRGMIALKDAKDERGYQEAAVEFRKALRLAPWWSAAAYNLALVQEKLKQYDAAVVNFKLSLLAEPDTPKATEIRAKLVELEYRQEKRTAAKATLERGRNLAAGRGVTKDRAAAAAAYQEACEGGQPKACSHLGWLALYGEGVARDEARAADLFKRACEGGVESGCRGLRPPDQRWKDRDLADFIREMGGLGPAIHDGEPALRFELEAQLKEGRARAQVFLHRSQRGLEPALHLQVYHSHRMSFGDCSGFLYLTPTRVAFDPAQARKPEDRRNDAFDAPRTTAARRPARIEPGVWGNGVKIELLERKYDFVVGAELLEAPPQWPSRPGSLVPWFDKTVPSYFVGAASSDFDAALARFDRLTADVREALGEDVTPR